MKASTLNSKKKIYLYFMSDYHTHESKHAVNLKKN